MIENSDKAIDTYNWFVRDAKILPTRRVMFSCKNKQCNHKWAREYVVKAQGKVMNGKFVDCLYRVSPEAIMYLEDDKNCPKCGYRWVKDSEVIGKVVEKPCDDRCLNATSHICNCSCGGRNHGGGILA